MTPASDGRFFLAELDENVSVLTLSGLDKKETEEQEHINM
jgi:hypothetical protein